MPLYNDLKAMRENRELSQTELGKLCGVSRQTISSIERGDYHPSVVLALKLAELFETSVETIFWVKENENEGL